MKSHFEYDENDNLIKVTDPLGNVTKYGYDVMGNMTSYVDARGKVTKYTYDLEGNLTSREDPAGRKETFGYDEKGRLTSWTMPSGKKVKYDYDKLNNLLEKSYEDAKESEGSGGNGNAGSDGNVSGSGKDEASGSGEGDGNASGSDGAGNTGNAGSSGGADDATKNGTRVTYAYNGAGEHVSMQDVTGKSTYEYDALGRLSKVTNGSGKEASYIYDEADNLAAVVYPDGTWVSYEYDLNDNIVKVTDREGKVTEYTHDALNRVTGTVRPNGTRTEVTYDAEDHVTKLVNICGDCGEVISSYEYAYNAQGYIVSETATELEAGSRKDPGWDEWYGGCTTGAVGRAVGRGVSKYLGELPFPLTRNRYAYALNNPLNYKDPTGRKSKAVGKAVSGVFGGAAGGVMGSVFGGTNTKQKVDRPVKDAASFQRKSVQRETGNASGAVSGHSKGGNASGSSGHSKGGNLPASDSTGNKAGNMAAGDTGNLTGMSGVTGNQRSNYKRQMAKVRMEQSKKVTCAAGQKNVSANVMVGNLSGLAPWLWGLLGGLSALSEEALALLALYAPWIIGIAGIIGVVYLTGTWLVEQSQSDDESEENKKEPDPGELEGKSQEEILEGLPDGWTYTDNNGFVHVRDEQGRVRIDPPDKKTKYKHIHVYDENGNLLDVNGNPVSPKDPAGHIPIAD